MKKPSLAQRDCVPCRGGVLPLKGKNLSDFHRMLSDPTQWSVINQHHIVRTYKFPDFRSALAFVNKVGKLAEQQGHHPDILLGWGKVEITLWTHVAGGLTESDFILAAKIDEIKG